MNGAELDMRSGETPDVVLRGAFVLDPAAGTGRAPADEERRAAEALVREHGLSVFCRALFNANEFVHVR